MEFKPLRKDTMLLNMGPSHPAMHGIIRILLELDGERVVKADVEIGYLHRAFEKTAENKTYLQVIPYTDRLNYVSPIINNVGYCMTVEKLLGIEVPERAQYIRVIMSEISRITDHLTCLGPIGMETGAFTVFIYMMRAREFLYDVLEHVTGARLTVSYVRIGGVKADLPSNFENLLKKGIEDTKKCLKETHGLLTKNKIFIDRTRNVGVISQQEAISYGFTGPVLRSTGFYYDVRKAFPYLIYDQLDFDVPLGERGDNYDRYMVRMLEIEQSIRIIEQAMKKMPKGEVMVDKKRLEPFYAVDTSFSGKRISSDAVKISPNLEGSEKERNEFIYSSKFTPPPKEDVYTSIEGLIKHFMFYIPTEGIKPPKGEVYFAVEGANGELGYYLVSDGSSKPYRLHVRAPCFHLMAGFHKMIEGYMVADIIPTFASINMIGGELER